MTETTLGGLDLSNLDMESVLENSYKDFHAKGLDYICLHRSPELTIKAYFFEGDAQDASEVVNPHDHRYNFHTTCLSGKIRNKWYQEPLPFDVPTEEFNVFAWHTPLNGGAGFADEQSRVRLAQYKHVDALPGKSYSMLAHELHTIQVMKKDTVILLTQFEDVVPLNEPTYTFTKSDAPPDLSGLYGKFTADQAMKRIELLQELSCRI
ncbi:hypothetical protein R2325_16520 [Mycobacteroides chelonae]|jgi:hypothetical protein|uniref:hypothetical protein n=1 Tax=Mycobacteroides TaxID=670516 RepID=UPI00092659E2|nr:MULTISPECIES: hypothetical protein [Mycobacteroides]MBV6360457.1 hypothetical protein [Mycobacteroides chelonae]MEC4857180.1 hypothetical protein [Mycobacteroides chelonae]MEC4873589.1 hypothetical protein [Mycobacteroides chelonae]SHW93984.1 Uncharacterised protein [Mycobacteroides abscessus subsp. abscessus]SKL80182.1 Uncharacterised protein [Mycobacteroides abscessus subsp. abscessus]